MSYPGNAVVRFNNIIRANDPVTNATDLLSWTQQGTLMAPTAFVAWAVQPRDPAKAPYEESFEASLFNATIDVRGFYGYNASRAAAAEPFARWGLEQDFEQPAATHSFEVYLEIGNLGVAPTDSRRPIFVNYNRTPTAAYKCNVAFTCGTGTTDTLSLGSDDGTGAQVIFVNLPGVAAGGPLTFGIASRNLELDAQLFNVVAGGNASIASSGGFVQVYGHTHTYIDSDADVVIRPDGVVAMAEFGSSKIHLHPAPIAVPAAPAAGTYNIFIDSADGKLKTQGSGGTLTIIGSP